MWYLFEQLLPNSLLLDYKEAVDYLAGLAPRGWRLGLDRMQEFARRAGLNDAIGVGSSSPQFIHVGGTNGKGTTTAFVERILRESGFRTGSFYSPYVYDLRERVQVDGKPISQTDFARLVTKLRPVGESFSEADFGGVTEFEFKTAVGFLYWKERACDWVALEVGLGGRLDSTNIVTPAASVIASIALDHTSILGGTHRRIALEKAGIIKADRPVVIGRMPPSAIRAIQEVAERQGSVLWRFGVDVRHSATRDGLVVSTPAGTVYGLHPSISGAHVPQNMALAIAAVHAAGLGPREDDLRRAVAATKIPGRYEIRRVGERFVILDGAHNAAAAQSLAQSLEQDCRIECVLLANMVQGHTVEPFFRPLRQVARVAHVPPIDFHRALEPEETAGVIGSLFGSVTVHGDLQSAFYQALKDVPPGGTLVVTGSFYLVGEVGRLMEQSGYTL